MLAFSCKNQFNELSNNSTSGYGTIYFVDSSRTVLETVEKDDFTKIILYAKKSDSLEAQKISEWKSYSDFVQSTVSVAIGTYDFYLEAFAGNVKFESDEITAEIKENQKINVNFVLHLVDKGEGNGNVKITYLFDEYNVASADFKLYKVEYVDDDKGGKIRTLNNVDVSFEGNDENPEGDWDIWGDSENPEQENYCIFEKSIPAGQYELTVRFETESEDYVAEYSTSVSVSEGITSSKEITIENFNPYYAITYNGVEDSEPQELPEKYSMYDKIEIPSLTKNYYEFQGWYLDENFAEPFEGITRYGNMRGNLNLFPKWKLKESQYLLFDYESVNDPNKPARVDCYKFSMFEENLDREEISEGNPLIPTNYEFPVIGGPDFFYYLIDDEGVYVLKKSNEENFNIDAVVEVSDGFVGIDDIFYDNESDTLYGLGTKYSIEYSIEGEDLVAQDLVLCSYNKNKDRFTLTSTFNAGYHFDGTTEHNTFVVRNNKTYILYKKMAETNSVYLDIFDPNSGVPTKTINISNSFDNKANLSINDMTVIDEKIYILWSYYSIPGGSEYNSVAPSKIESFGGVLCVDEYETVENLFKTPSKEKEINIPGSSVIALVNYYGPSSDEDKSYLFGPTKFIAIKPKKLVFADEGIFVYNDTDDPNNPKYKNINRVVEIDLENNRAVKDVSVSFTKDMESVIDVYSSYSSIVNDATVSEE